MYGGLTTNSAPAGSLWEDGGLSATRVIERFLHQEEQGIFLSDLLQGSQTEYDRNGAHSQLLVSETNDDSAVFAKSISGKAVYEGCLLGTSYLWRAQGADIYLWDCLDKSRSRSCHFHGPSNWDVVKLGVATMASPISGGCKYWLVVITLNEVALYYFDPDSISEDTTPILSGYVAVTGGVTITCISSMSLLSSRIFLGGSDGSVFELIVREDSFKPKSFWSACVNFVSGIPERRCYLSVIHRPGGWNWLSNWLSMSSSGTSAGVKSVEVDTCRNLLFVLQGDNSVTVYSTIGSQCTYLTELSSYTVQSAVSSALSYSSGGSSGLLSSSSSDSHSLVSLVPSSPHVGGDVWFVAVTKSGARLFVGARGGNYYFSSRNKSSSCKQCKEAPGLGASYSQWIPLTVLFTRLADRHPALDVKSAFSYDFARTMFLVSASGLVVVRPDEASVVHKQKDHNSVVRERYDYVPIAGSVRFSTMVDDGVESVGESLLSEKKSNKPPSCLQIPNLLPIASDDLCGTVPGVLKKRLLVLSSEGRETIVSVPRSTELVVAVLQTQNLHAIRDLSIQYGSDQLAALFISILALLSSVDESSIPGKNYIGAPATPVSLTSIVERILFSQDTATALGLVNLGSITGSAVASAVFANPLGGVTPSSQSVSARVQGAALFVSRIIRPVWFAKAFSVTGGGSVLCVKPRIVSNSRNLMLHLLEPVLEFFHKYRFQLNSVAESAADPKIVDGLVSLVTRLAECMELFRLVENGLLTVRGGGDKSLTEIAESQGLVSLLNEIESLQVRDIVNGSVGAIELLLKSADGNMLKKHCPLLFAHSS